MIIGSRRILSSALIGSLAVASNVACTRQQPSGRTDSRVGAEAKPSEAGGNSMPAKQSSFNSVSVSVKESNQVFVPENTVVNSPSVDSSLARSAQQSSSASPQPATSAKFVAQLRRSIPSLSLRSRGIIEMRNGCLVAIIGSEITTLVLPPHAKIETKGGTVRAVSYSGQRLPLGVPVSLSGGGADIRSSDLRQPLPDRCPKSLFVIGG
jgi:hypothetical protein